ncbi:MAG: hypothetical protein ACRECW_04090 [Phyllobacterium sp.]
MRRFLFTAIHTMAVMIDRERPGLLSIVTFATKSAMDDLDLLSLHEGSGSSCAKTPA